jgi:hypothetical protein
MLLLLSVVFYLLQSTGVTADVGAMAKDSVKVRRALAAPFIDRLTKDMKGNCVLPSMPQVFTDDLHLETNSIKRCVLQRYLETNSAKRHALLTVIVHRWYTAS